jgi:hypothetical protein
VRHYVTSLSHGLISPTSTACIRKFVLKRLQELGLEILRLPVGATEQDKHIPILVSADLADKHRIIVLFPERDQDLGIFSYRTIGNENISRGSAIDFVSLIMNGVASSSGQEIPGIVIANPGQLLWYRGGGRAVSRTQWANLPRESAVAGPFRVDEVKNKVSGNEDFKAHVKYVFENVINEILHKDARIDVIGLEWPGQASVMYLAANWEKYGPRVRGICLASPQHDPREFENADFIDFISERGRAYFVSSSPVGTLIDGREDFGCECYASGEEMYPENIIVKATEHMLTWLATLED